jgi:hypothetical protein
VRIDYPGAATFEIRDGREIVVDPGAGMTQAVLRLFILGPALAVALHQRGRLVLHGSAVLIDQEAVLFLGCSGEGKSTLAAALHARGHPLLTDDVAALALDRADPEVFPGYPFLRVWPDTVSALGESSADLPRLHPRLEKRGRPSHAEFPRHAVRVRRIYILDRSRGRGPAIEPLAPQAAFVELVRHSFGARSLVPLHPERHFTQCTQLAGRASVSRLESRTGLNRLGDLAAMVEKDLAGAD